MIDIDNLQIVSPCAVAWDEMVGDDKIRYCGYCEKDVFNLTMMTRPEIETLLASQMSGRKICGQMRRRPDGKLVTADCVTVKEQLAGRGRGHLSAFLAMLLSFFGASSAFSQDAFDTTSNCDTNARNSVTAPDSTNAPALIGGGITMDPAPQKPAAVYDVELSPQRILTAAIAVVLLIVARRRSCLWVLGLATAASALIIGLAWGL